MKKNILQIGLILLVSIMAVGSLSFKQVDLSDYNTAGLDLNFHVPSQNDQIIPND